MSARKTADLPLTAGTAVLSRRAVDRAGAISTRLVRDEGPIELLKRLSDPFWFQAFASAIGCDWRAGGVTTEVCAALKEATRRHGRDMGIVVCGGKGAGHRKTTDDIRRACEHTGDRAEPFTYASRLAVKVDAVAVQDGYDLYHHSFLFAPGTNVWCVIQQGRKAAARAARRYHWYSEQMASFVADPHAAIACDKRGPVLNLVAGECERHRQAITALTREHPERILREAKTLLDGNGSSRKRSATLKMSATLQPTIIKRTLLKTNERQACDFEELLGEADLDAADLRALSLLAELIYQAPASRRDPAVHGFARGGKEGLAYLDHPKRYDDRLERLRETIAAAKLDHLEILEAERALASFQARLAR